jgi:hypothetical protein
MDEVNVDETKIGKFLYEVVKKAMVEGNELHCVDVFGLAHDLKLITQKAYYCYILQHYNSYEFKKDIKFKDLFEQIDKYLNINSRSLRIGNLFWRQT